MSRTLLFKRRYRQYSMEVHSEKRINRHVRRKSSLEKSKKKVANLC